MEFLLLSAKEFWGVTHGMVLGAIFLLAYAGGLAGFYSLRQEWITPAGLQERFFRLKVGVWVMTIASWLTVIVGTWVVYPWYRAKPPAGIELTHHFPRSYLLANPRLSAWHNFGMEWKEHVAWLAPMLTVAVLYILYVYGKDLLEDRKMRNVVIVLYTLAFFAAAAAGLFGALITKVAPI